MPRRPLLRSAVVLPVVTSLLMAAAGATWAVARAQAESAQAVGPVATFGAQAQLPGVAQTGPLVLSYVDKQNDARVFVLRNTGSLSITAQTWSVTVQNTSGGVKGSGELAFCETQAPSCSTYMTTPFLTVEEGRTGTIPTNQVLAPGATVNVRFTPVGGLRQHNTTINVAVTRSQASPGARTSAA